MPVKTFFYQLVRRLEEAGELSKETVFIDGTKLEACANKYTFVWKKSVGKWEEKMFQKIEEAIQLLNREYLQNFSIAPETRTQDLQKIVRFFWKKNAARQTILFLSMDVENGKAKTNGIWNFSADLWNGRPFMIGIRQVFRGGTIIVKQTRMQPLCT